MKKIGYMLLIIGLVFIGYGVSQINFSNTKNNYEEKHGDTSTSINPFLWVATDGLGREVPTDITHSNNKARLVGMFYWTWHLENNSTGPYNVNNISNNNPDKNNDYTWWNNNYALSSGSSYWWNESIYGYYMENDDYVLRKQAELLADAGVDFVAFDCTNGHLTWESAYENLLKVWLEAKNDGVNVPKIVFMLPFTYSNDTYISFMDIYNNLYKPDSENYKKYNSLLFYYNLKPLILLDRNGVPSSMEELLANFEVRKMEPSYFINDARANGTWGWLSTYPQAYYNKVNREPEQISVGVAQNANYKSNTLAAMNGVNIMGRSYANGDYSYNYNYRGKTITVGSTITGESSKSSITSLYGRNFQQQWDRALEIDPEVVFVTGWNEWIMGRFSSWQGTTNAFPDEFNDEYSRDIEPSTGELKDYYYYQLVSNIRKYKGVSSQISQNTPITINQLSDWNNSSIINYNHYVGGKNRNIKGFGKSNPETYVNNTFRNDIKTAKVSYDASNIYFYVETVNALSSYSSDKWMRLLIDTKNSTTSTDTDNWEEFEYILNRTTGTNSTLVLEKSKGGWNFDKVGDVSYIVNNNALQVTIPRSYLGLTNKSINFNFKWCDNNLDNGDIMSIYTNGDAAPGGRFAFHFSGTSEYAENIEATGISLDKTSANVKVGETVTLKETITPSNTTNKTVTWTSDKTNIATVSGGVVTGVSEGTATITVTTSNGKKATSTITVTSNTVEATGISLDKTSANVKVGETVTLKETITPSNTTNKTVIWTSDKTNIATVLGGVVTGVSEGTATITVTTSNGKKATSTITVTSNTVEATGISLDKTSASVKVGETVTLKETITPSNTTNKTVTWTSDKTNIATVSGGVVTGVSEGTATITVTTSNGKKATSTITVTKVEEAYLCGGSSIVGTEGICNTNILYNDTLNVISSDNSIVSISDISQGNDGYLQYKYKCLKAGNVTISLEGGESVSSSIEVIVPESEPITFEVSPNNIFLPIDDGSDYGRIIVKGIAKKGNTAIDIALEMKTVNKDIVVNKSEGDSITISAISGSLDNTCKNNNLIVSAKDNDNNSFEETINVCVYCNGWKKSEGTYRFESSQFNRTEMLTKSGCDAYEDLNEELSNANDNVYVYNTKYNRCCNSTVIDDVPKTAFNTLYAIYIAITLFTIIGIVFIAKTKVKQN